jgi:RNA polymerase sigma-70 factor, ECF subfamily
MATNARELALAPRDDSSIDWRRVYERDFPRIYNYFRYRIGVDAIAEDLTAETFARAWRSRRLYDSDLSAFSTWLFSIARNLAIDYYQQRRVELGLEAAGELAGEESVESTVQRRQEVARLSQLLAGLPDREHEILALRYGGDLSYRDIGRQLELSTVNVRVIVYRTVRRLRAQWKESS